MCLVPERKPEYESLKAQITLYRASTEHRSVVLTPAG